VWEMEEVPNVSPR